MPQPLDEQRYERLQKQLVEQSRQLASIRELMQRPPENSLQTLVRWWKDQRARSQIVDRG